MEHGGVLLLHPHRGAAPVDISGVGQQLLLGQHGDGLFTHRPGRLFQVQRVPHRDVEHIQGLGGPPGHQGLEHALRVLAHAPGHGDAVHRHPVLMGVGVGGEGDALLLQNPHDIGLFLFFGHSSIPLFLYSSSPPAIWRGWCQYSSKCGDSPPRRGRCGRGSRAARQFFHKPL